VTPDFPTNAPWPSKKPACSDEQAAGDFIDHLVPRADHDVGNVHKAALLLIALYIRPD
jgi:hypothetical protein